MRFKRTLLLIFLIIAGAVLGALVATLCAGIPGLSWLAFSRPVGFSPEAPLQLELPMLRFSFGLVIDISVAQVLIVGVAIVLYNILVRRK